MSNFNPKTFKSLEFLILVLTSVAPWAVSAASSAIDHREALIWSVVGTAAYALARGLAKMNSDTKDYWHTTEFWVTVLGAAAATVGYLNDTLGGQRWAQLAGLLGAVLVIARGLAKEPMIAAGAIDAAALATPVDVPIADPTSGLDGDDSVHGT